MGKNVFLSQPMAPDSGEKTTLKDGVNSKSVILVACIAAFMGYLDLSVVHVVFPAMNSSFGDVPQNIVTWMLYAYPVVLTALTIPAGRFADVLGRRRFFVTGLVLFGCSSAATGFAKSAVVLVILLAVQAVGAACFIPASLALVLQTFSIRHEASAVAAWTGSAVAAVGLGPLIGGVIANDYGWRWAFIVNVPLALLALVVTVRVVPDSREASGEIPGLLSLVMLTGGVTFLAIAISQGKQMGWTSPSIVAGFILGAFLLAGFIISSYGRRPMVAPELLFSRSTSLANVSTFLFATAFFAALVTSLLFLGEVWKYPALRTGLAIVPMPLLAASVAVFAGFIAGRRGSREVTVVGALMVASGAVWMLLEGSTHPQYLAVWLPAMSLLGLGAGLCLPALAVVAVSDVHPDRLGTGSALNAGARQLGAVVGFSLVGVIVEVKAPGNSLLPFQEGWVLVIAAALAAVIPCLAFRKVIDLREEPKLLVRVTDYIWEVNLEEGVEPLIQAQRP